MKKSRRLWKILSMVLVAVMIAASPVIPEGIAFAAGSGSSITVETGGKYEKLTDALAVANDGDTITLLNDITESVVYTVTVDKTITIDGGGHTLKGTSGGTYVALELDGTGTLNFKNITLRGGDSSMLENSSVGLKTITGSSVTVQNEGTVSAIGGAALYSYGVYHYGTGVVNITNAFSGGAGAESIGADNATAGTINVAVATGGAAQVSYGVVNEGIGTINVSVATGGAAQYSYGVANAGTGTINATNATGGEAVAESIGAYNHDTGTINIANATGGTASDLDIDPGKSYGVYNEGSGTVNVVTANCSTAYESDSWHNDGSGITTVGTDTALLTLYKGTGASCVLDSIIVAASGTTAIGTLPSVYKDGETGKWYPDGAKTAPITGTTVSGETILHSTYSNAHTVAFNKNGGDTAAKPAKIAVESGESIGTLPTAPKKAGYVLNCWNTAANGTGVVFTTGTAVTADTTLYAQWTKRNLTVGTGGGYASLTDALSGAEDGDAITLLNDIEEQVQYTVTVGRKVTIDGAGYKVIGTDDELGSYALELSGSGTITLKNITLQGGTSLGAGATSIGLCIKDGSVSVQSEGTVNTIGGKGVNSVGVYHNGLGAANITAATGGEASMESAGAYNAEAGTINVATATGGEAVDESEGVYNYSTGTINVSAATGGKATNASTGTSYGIYNKGTGTVNAIIANCSTATKSGILYNESTGIINTGTNAAILTLKKGTGVNCVLESIAVAAVGNTQIGLLPIVSKDGAIGKWFSNQDGSTEFTGSTVTGPKQLYSSFYVAENNAAAPYTVSSKGKTGGSASVSVYSAALLGTANAGGSLPVNLTDNGRSAVVRVGSSISGGILGESSPSITLPEIPGANAYILELPENLLAGASGTNITFFTHFASLRLGSNMFSTRSGAGGAIGISIAEGDRSALSNELQTAIGTRPMIDISANLLAGPGTNPAKEHWNNPEAPVAVAIPYTPTADELTNPEHIVVWYIDGSGNAVPVPSGRYNASAGRVSFATTHMSQYAVAYVTKSFEDLEHAAWAKNQIEVLASKGILRGISEKEYAPKANITRADFLYSLVRTLDVHAKIDGNFDDVSKDAYYYEEIGIARKLGITQGMGSNRFNPDGSITRQDMMVLTERALKMQNKLKLQGAASDLETFSDKSMIAGYAADSIATLVKEGLITGNGKSIKPLTNSTRAETAVFLYRIYHMGE